MRYPIMTAGIKPSKKTIKITGLSTFDQIKSNSSKLFTDLNDDQLLELLNDVYNNKLAYSQKQQLVELSTEEKRVHLVNTLSFQLELRQETPRTSSPTNNTNVVSFLLRNRLNVSSSVSSKVQYQTVTFGIIGEYGYDSNPNFSEVMAEQGIFSYIFRENTFTPEMNDKGEATSAPKRSGKGGNILLKDEKLIFMVNKLVFQQVATPEEFDSLEEQMQAAEVANAEEFKHNSVIDIVENPIPAEVRNSETGAFAPEFQAWLHEYLNISVGAQVDVAA